MEPTVTHVGVERQWRRGGEAMEQGVVKQWGREWRGLSELVQEYSYASFGAFLGREFF